MMGKRLRTLRKGLRMTQTDLSEYLDVSASAVGMYEQDRRTPDTETISILCDLFDVSADYLLFGKDAPADESISVEEFCARMEQWIKHHKGLLYQPLPDDGRRGVSGAEIDRLADALHISAAIVFNIKKV